MEETQDIDIEELDKSDSDSPKKILLMIQKNNKKNTKICLKTLKLVVWLRK